jgi:hypothetical protein
MTQDFGMESHGKHAHSPLRAVSRYLVVIDAGGEALARLFDAGRVQVAEFDASTEEVAVMLRGLVPARGGAGGEWDGGLQGHSTSERAAAEVYTLDL